MDLSIDEVVEALNGRFNGRTYPIRGVTTDTREMRKGDIFFALKGPNFDGHQFIPEAIEKGASYVVSEQTTRYPDRTIVVQDTLRALGDLAKRRRRMFDLKVIAVTGSNGKTTTKEMIHAMLSSEGPAHKSQSSYNNLVGIPLTVFELTTAHRFAVLELGMNKAGEIARETEIIRPDVGVLTNIAPAHIGPLGSLSNIIKAKAELFDRLGKNHTAFINGDDTRAMKVAERTRARTCTFSVKAKSDYRATRLKLLWDRTEFSLRDMRFEIHALGIENVYNALAAIGVADVCGVGLHVMEKILRDFRPPHLRATVQTRGEVTIINDSYNSNPSSLKWALRWLTLSDGRRKIAVLGDMLELGESARRYHLQLGRFARNHCDMLIGVGALSKYLAEGMGTRRARYFENKEEALRFLKRTVRPGDAILIKGSRLMRMEDLARALLASLSS